GLLPARDAAHDHRAALRDHQHPGPVRRDRDGRRRRPHRPGGRGAARPGPGAHALRRETAPAPQEGGAAPPRSAPAPAEEVRPARRRAEVPVLQALSAVASTDRIRVAVAGASGYTGAELLRIVLGHPRVTLTGVTSERLAGEPLARVYPHLRGLTELSFHDL